jgi:hypothetical protein
MTNKSNTGSKVTISLGKAITHFGIALILFPIALLTLGPFILVGISLIPQMVPVIGVLICIGLVFKFVK